MLAEIDDDHPGIIRVDSWLQCARGSAGPGRSPAGQDRLRGCRQRRARRPSATTPRPQEGLAAHTTSSLASSPSCTADVVDRSGTAPAPAPASVRAEAVTSASVALPPGASSPCSRSASSTHPLGDQSGPASSSRTGRRPSVLHSAAGGGRRRSPRSAIPARRASVSRFGGCHEHSRDAREDSGYWSEDNATTAGPDVFIATTKDWKQRKAARELGATSGPPPADASVLEAMEHRLRTPEGAAAYATRSHTVEPVFGDTKANRGYRRFMRRGLEAANSEASLIFAVHNLLKIFHHNPSVVFSPS